MKDPKSVKQGKKNRAAGGIFELRVRKDLEEKGWIVDKWSNNVEFGKMHNTKVGGNTDGEIRTITDGKLIPAKRKYAGPGRPMAIGTGFPDFIAFRPMSCSTCFARMGDTTTENHKIIGCEVKSNGYLTPIEKQKCQWYLDNKIFKQIFIARKTKVKNRVVIVYEDYTQKYGK